MRSHHPWMIPVILLCCVTISAQSWTTVDPQNIPVTGQRDIVPEEYVAYEIDHATMKTILWSAPYDYVQSASGSNAMIMVGLADGTADYFRMVQYEMMEAPLAAQYTDIKTFRGISISNPYRTIRADWTKNGFRAVINDLGGKTYIDYFQRNDMANRIVYYADSFLKENEWICGLEDEDITDSYHSRVIGDCEFRTYRLAMATTGEYSNYFGATSSAQSALVMAQVVTAVNRVNDVYEADFATRLILVADTDDVFYYDGGTDPYSNSNGNSMLGQNQTTLDAIIGSANYDIGHVFSTGGGGVAIRGSLCDNPVKAGGVTGSPVPVGDPFVIDYVAHELGHQFGANHTQNNSCQRNASTAMEPGSASTIMGYAGICVPNVQSNSDDYMHGISLQEINNKISSISCEVVISLDNNPPTVNNVPNYTIPKSTPFVLTAVANDDEGDPLTYCWEQWDHEVGTMPPVSTSVFGPMFRSLDPTSSPSRYFPNLTAIVNGTSPTWEVLPSVTRDMEFRVTVRDLHDGMYGCTDEDNTIISTTATAGPFVVTSQSTPVTWMETENVTITWSVANTSSAPVNCANVDILLSLDGGMTYPTVMTINEPNDGSATVSVPAGTTTTGRIMVKGSGNIFFDINNANITINPGIPNFTIALNPISVSECNDGAVQTTVEVGAFMGFTDPVTLTALSLPPGAIATFTPPIVNPGSTSVLTISNLTGLFGNYTPIIRGNSTTGNKDVSFLISLLSPPASGPVLISPLHNATDAVITPLLDWQIIQGVTSYDFQLAYDNAFTQIAQTGSTIADKFQVTAPLIVGEQYFWRVRGNNSCGIGTWSGAFSFTTTSCLALNSTNVPVLIPVNGPTTVTSIFNCPLDMVINDINVINLTGSHSWISDLKFTLIAPDASERLIWNQPCSDHDNFNIQFDDEASPGMFPCPPTNGLFYRPFHMLSYFDGKHSGGSWTMEIEDVDPNADGGSLNSWGLKVCGTLSCQLTVNQTSGTGLGTLPGALNCASPGDTIRLGAMLGGQTINVGVAPLLLNKNVVILAESAGINVTGSGDRVFEIAPGVQIGMVGVLITAGNSMTGAAINNNGILKLKNTIIESSIVPTGASLIQNLPGGQLFVEGNCALHQ